MPLISGEKHVEGRLAICICTGIALSLGHAETYVQLCVTDSFTHHLDSWCGYKDDNDVRSSAFQIAKCHPACFFLVMGADKYREHGVTSAHVCCAGHLITAA